MPVLLDHERQCAMRTKPCYFFAITNLPNPRCVSCFVEKADGDSKLSEASEI